MSKPQSLQHVRGALSLSYRSLWQQAWQGLLQSTEIQELAAFKSKQYRGGDGDEGEYLEALQNSPLYQALQQCHQALVLSSNAQVRQTPKAKAPCFMGLDAFQMCTCKVNVSISYAVVSAAFLTNVLLACINASYVVVYSRGYTSAFVSGKAPY
jgi:hypothetical protein